MLLARGLSHLFYHSQLCLHLDFPRPHSAGSKVSPHARMAVAPNNGVMAGTVGFHRSSPGRNASTTSTANMAGSPTRPSTKLPVNSVVETKILNALPMPSELFYVIGENAPMIAMSRPQRRHRDGKKGRTGVKWWVLQQVRPKQVVHS